MTKPKPTVGQTLYTKSGPVIVEKVGRKYFTVKDRFLFRQYYLSDWRVKSEITGLYNDYKLYETQQEIDDGIEKAELKLKIMKSFNLGGVSAELTLQALRDINAIIDKAITKG